MPHQPEIDALVREARRFSTAQERAAYLDRVCGSDTELREAVDQRLGLELQATMTPGGGTAADAMTEGPGSAIGPYRITGILGQGGFGTVFLAEQDKPLRRQVALKITQLGLDTR